MKLIFFILIALSMELKAENLTKSANESLNLNLNLNLNKIYEKESENMDSNILGIPDEEFKELKKSFLKALENCSVYSEKFKINNKKDGHLYIKGYKIKKERYTDPLKPSGKQKYCVVDVKMNNDYADYCEYEKSILIDIYIYYSHDYFKEGKEKSRYGNSSCIRFF
jgi:hypothetical protein